MKRFIIISWAIILVFSSLSFHAQVMGQSISLTNVTANAGDDILMPLEFNGLTNVGAISLYVLYNGSSLSFTGITNQIPEIGGVLANAMVNPTQIGISWLASGTSGVDFPNGKALDLQFTFNAGSSPLDFATYCEVVDWEGNIINITYFDGSVMLSGFALSLKAYLEGPFNSSTSLMKTDLASFGYIPLVQPFGPSLPYYGNPNPQWYYNGTESVVSLPTGVVDWVMIELRDAPSANQATGATMIAQRALFILANGDIVDLDGISTPFFNLSIDQGLFVVVYHRNHLPIMNSDAIPEMAPGLYIYDYSTASGQIYGGAIGCKQLQVSPAVWGLISADGNADGQVNTGDKEAWKVDSGSSGYKAGDFNLDGQINSQDKVEKWKINGGSGSQVPN